MLTKIRKELLKTKDYSELKDFVESDEAWFGKKDNQQIVLGMIERNNRKLRLFIIPNVKEKTLYPYIKKFVKKGSCFYTDSRISYAFTSINYHHQVTNHSKGEFARNGQIHSNTIEQIWGDIKGIIRTIHHGISKKYRQLYFAEYIFKYENKHSSNLFFNLLCQLFSPMYCII